MSFQEFQIANRHPKKPRSAPHQRLSYLDPRYRKYLGVGLFVSAAMAMVQHTLGFYFQDQLNLSSVEAAQSYSFAMMVASAAIMMTQLVVVRNWSLHPIKLLRLGIPFMIIGYISLASADSLVTLLLCMACFGVGVGMTLPGISVTTTLLVASEEQGAIAGLTASIAGMGFVIGPLWGGFVYAINPELTYWSAGLILVPVLAVVWQFETPEMT